MLMRFLWGLAIGHTYTWKDQQEESSYYAKLDSLIVSSSAPVPPPARKEGPVQMSASFVSSACVGTLAPVSSWTDSPPEGHPLDRNEDGYCNNQIGDDEDWEEEEDDDDEGSDQEEVEDEWDLRNDEEVIMYDAMYKDWHLYDG
ncbi:hypothetical protein BKA70DRAFT_1223776 [Coprinopsis sp. MPI-PUGE-AT-0042]|nr:hypothetical protein BKA70DRAFT_1223776 [Coprinopsis sp. MPI-PUGE-AT-0042]